MRRGKKSKPKIQLLEVKMTKPVRRRPLDPAMEERKDAIKTSSATPAAAFTGIQRTPISAQITPNAISSGCEAISSKVKETRTREEVVLTEPVDKGKNPMFSETKPAAQAKNWSKLFEGNNLAARGMNLRFIALIITEEWVIVQLCPKKFEKETEQWRMSLIVYVVGDDPSIGALEIFISVKWNYIAKPQIYYYNDGYFVVRFNCLADRDEVLYSGPNIFRNKPLIVKLGNPISIFMRRC